MKSSSTQVLLLLATIKTAFQGDALKFVTDSKHRVIFPNPNSKCGMDRAKALLKEKLFKEDFKKLVFTEGVVCKISIK